MSILVILLVKYLPSSVLARLKALVPVLSGVAGVLVAYYGEHSRAGTVATAVVALVTAMGVYALPNVPRSSAPALKQAVADISATGRLYLNGPGNKTSQPVAVPVVPVPKGPVVADATVTPVSPAPQ